MTVQLLRRVSSIYIPDVDVVPDEAAFNQMFAVHMEEKQLLQDLILGGVDHEEVLEALEVYIGTPNMDSYIEKTESELDSFLDS